MRFDGHTWTVEFPVYIHRTYLNGRYDIGVAGHGYAAYAPFIETSKKGRYHYAKRFGSRPVTDSPNKAL
jgi:hypothetical protein